MAEEKLFGKYNELVLILIGFLLTGIVGTYIAQVYTTKNAELSAANKIFSEYSQLAGDRYFTMNQVMLAHSQEEAETTVAKRWLSYRTELQRWNTRRGYNREMIKLYFGQALWSQERDIHHFFRAWGISLEKAKYNKQVVDFVCLEKEREQFLRALDSFNFALGKAIQEGNIGNSKSNKIQDKKTLLAPPCLN